MPGQAYAAGVVRRWALIVAGPLFLLSLSAPGAAQAPLPILRGIVVMPTGESRAYLEDAQTGSLAGYAIRDVVADSRIVEIRDDRVVLRRGGDVIHVFIGGVSSTYDRENQVSAPITPPPTTPGVERGPVIGNGETWLDHLGIPPNALSRAIEAVPTKGPDNLEDD